ncbi:MAG: DUF2321 domain-containing protein [Anaerolineae bacterium]|nr:DUF2321 domain-containing protein [Anaerolineae bacterium]
MESYDIAQICLNGHVITDRLKRAPDRAQKFCDKCGEPTISQCQSCNALIRGYYHIPGSFIISNTSSAPGYCYECGKPYPWIERKLQAAWELADELEELSEEEKQKLKSSLEEVTRDTPKTEVATTKLKKLLSKLGKESYQLVKQTLVEIATEAAKKALFGG